MFMFVMYSTYISLYHYFLLTMLKLFYVSIEFSC